MPKKTKNPSLDDVMSAIERDVLKKPKKKATAKKRTPIWKAADNAIHRSSKKKPTAKKRTPSQTVGAKALEDYAAHSASGVPTVRSQREIDVEITRLTELRGLVPKRSLFGDDNIARLNAQIDTLSNLYDDEEVTDTYLHSGEDDAEPTDAAFDIEQIAMEASNWLYEKGRPKPSLDWEHLAKPKGKK